MTGTISRSQIQKLFNQNEAYLSLIIVAYSILVTSLNPSFLSFENLLDLGKVVQAWVSWQLSFCRSPLWWH